MNITLQRLWSNDDGMLEISASIVVGVYATAIDVDVYPATLAGFAARLQAFPASLSDQPVLELGSSADDSYGWLTLRAYVRDALGHSAMAVSMKKNGSPEEQAQCQFTALTDPASLNRLGQQLAAWCIDNEEALLFDDERPA